MSPPMEDSSIGPPTSGVTSVGKRNNLVQWWGMSRCVFLPTPSLMASIVMES
jgi:hypothetical protein